MLFYPNNIKNTIDEFVKMHNEIDVNKETTIVSSFKYLDYTLKQKIYTLCEENSDVVHDVIVKHSLEKVNVKKIDDFVKLRNNKTHLGIIEWKESASIYLILFAVTYACFFKQVGLQNELIKKVLLPLF